MASSIASTFCIDNTVPAEALEKIFQNENLADFYFLFNEGIEGLKRVPAHKLILKATSDVFATKLNGEWKEKSEVEIEDASSTAFIEFLQFLYLSKVNVSLENVCEVVYLANKYNVRKCIELCAKIKLTSDDVCTGLDLALQHDLSELRDRCVEKISGDTRKVLETDGFLRCSKDALKTILAMDDTDCYEIEIFEACLNWAKHACKTKEMDPVTANIRKELGDCLYRIRFGAMTPKQIADCVAENDGLFTASEQKDLLMAIGSKQSRVQIFKNTAARGKLWKYNDEDDELLECDLSDIMRVLYGRDCLSRRELTTFKINKPLLFAQIFIGTIFEGYSRSDSDDDDLEYKSFGQYKSEYFCY